MGRSSRFVALLTALTAAALAQQSAALTGKVTNAVTGAPVVRAHVTLRAAKTFGALTNSEGKFSITGIEPGEYIYKAERVGFTTDKPRIGAEAMTLHDGDNSLDLKLTPLGAVGGRVVNADGEPVQLVTVEVQGILGGQSTTTDAKGQYRIGGLVPGRYRIKVRLNWQDSPPEIRSDGSKEIHYRSTYYPGVAESKAAARITVTPGSETSGIDIPLLTAPIVKVSGKTWLVWILSLDLRDPRGNRSDDPDPVIAVLDVIGLRREDDGGKQEERVEHLKLLDAQGAFECHLAHDETKNEDGADLRSWLRAAQAQPDCSDPRLPREHVVEPVGLSNPTLANRTKFDLFSLGPSWTIRCKSVAMRDICP